MSILDWFTSKIRPSVGPYPNLTPQQRVEFYHSEGRRIVNAARQAIEHNKQLFEIELARVNAVHYAAIKEAESAYQLAKEQAVS